MSLLSMDSQESSLAPQFEIQRIAGRDKKAFLSDQWKEMEENNRMGKTRDLFKKIRDTRGTFHVKMGFPDGPVVKNPPANAGDTGFWFLLW